jgi:hypothetical protein
VDRLEALKFLEFDEEVRKRLIELAGGSEQLAFRIAQILDIEVSAKDAARVLESAGVKLSPSGIRKRIQKIKGKKSPKSDPEVTQKRPQATRKRPSRKRPQ